MFFVLNRDFIKIFKIWQDFREKKILGNPVNLVKILVQDIF